MERELSSRKVHRSTRAVPFVLSITLLLCVAAAYSQTTQRVWIEFRDKGIDPASFHPGAPAFDSVVAHISPVAIARREQALGTTKPELIISIEDAPLFPPYLDSLRDIGVASVSVAKWENACSAAITAVQYAALKRCPFVHAIVPVGKGILPTAVQATHSVEPFEENPMPTDLALAQASVIGDIPPDSIISHYGTSASQLNRIDVPPLHALGFDATGVHLGFLDTGFRWRVTSAELTRNIVAEYDFVFHDSITANQDNDISGQDAHGTQVLSCSAGYLPDSLVGPAYGATIMLAKTEDERSERPIEEDNYANALEWMEQNGIQLTTSSLGYLNFDSGFVSHTYADMNGHTTIAARAIERAAHLGVLCLNAIGNSGDSPYTHMLTPADADSMIAVGALDANDTIAGFSSRGPTYDGRIKPDICAPGVSVAVEDPAGGLDQTTGTSFATPLSAGCCALIFQAHPEATAQQIRRAVLQTGVRSGPPDTAYGWGRIDAYRAALFLGTVIGPPRVVQQNGIATLYVGMASQNGILSGSVIWDTGSPGQFLNRMSIVAEHDTNRYEAQFPLLPPGTVVRYILEAIDGADTATYLPRDTARHVFTFVMQGTSSVVETRSAHSLIELSPNPASDQILITRTGSGNGFISILDLLGREVYREQLGSDQGRVVIPTYNLLAGSYFVRYVASGSSSANNALTRFVVVR